jgi:hypothetical protein
VDAGMIDDQITILISTSHVPEHPETTTIDETVSSIRQTLPKSLIVIQCDGLSDKHAEDPKRMLRYQGYKYRLQGRYDNSVVLEYDANINQAGMLGRALEYVKTPLICYLEHDWCLSPNIEWERLGNIILSGMANYVKFHAYCRIHPFHWGMMVDHVIWDGVPLFRTLQYSQNPHLASTDFYRAIYASHLHDRTGAIEEIMHGPCACGPWDRWKLTIYDPENEGTMQMCRHIDGRKGER